MAIAGLGGVGGSHLVTLARLGIGHFHIADFDRFALVNFNRQMGASTRTLEMPKAEVMAAQARDINPEAEIRVFEDGVTEDNLDAFLDGVDLFVDGLDFFVLDIRAKVFARCRELGIPAITAAPIGMGTALLTFLPGEMAFEEYFRLEDASDDDRRQVRFLTGLAPSGLQRGYLADPSRVNFDAQQGPSTAMACMLCSGVLGVEALKVLLGRGGVRAAPVYQHFDAYLGKWIVGKLRWGNRGPVQTIKRALTYRALKKMAREARSPDEALPDDAPVIRKILDLARWAPSGDNEQPWKFEMLGDHRVRIHVSYEPGANIYEYDNGRPIRIAAGMLVETIAIAATHFGWRTNWAFVDGSDGWVIDVAFSPDPAVAADPLAPAITTRSVDRRPYRRAHLTEDEKSALSETLPSELEIRWLESRKERWAITRLNMRAAGIRLTNRDAFKSHQKVIKFGEPYARRGMPVEALGLDAFGRVMLSWMGKKWWRTALINRLLGGTLIARLQLDLVQGLNCGAHFAVRWRDGRTAPSAEDLVNAGRAWQRFWLTAERRGLVSQPGFAPLIFAYYGGAGDEAPPGAGGGASQRLNWRAHAVLGEPGAVAFLGRIGRPRSPAGARSLRLPLNALMKD